MKHGFDIADRIEYEIARFCEPHICYGGGKGSKAPPAPDPQATAAAQAAANKETAIAQAGLNMTNQRDAFGNALTFNQIGQWSDGTPRYEAVQTLSPEQQAIFRQQEKLYGDALTGAQTLLGNVQNTIGQAPPSFDENYRKQQLAALLQRQQPQLDRDRAALETQLANQGISLGSDAYNTAMQQFNQRLNDLNLAADAQAGSEARSAYQAALAGRNQPINELGALLGLGQVQTPSFANAPQTGVSPTDVIGPTNLAYQGQLASWQAGQNRSNSAMGGLFGLGAAALGGWGSNGFNKFW